MKTLLHKLLKLLGFYGTLDTDKALREKNRRILELEKQVEQMQGFQVVYVDPTVRQNGYAQSAWNSEPEKHTDPMRVQGIRQRATMREVYPDKRAYVQHANDTERKRFVTRKLGDPTAMLPKMPHKYNLMTHSDGPPSEDDTLHTPATWLL